MATNHLTLQYLSGRGWGKTHLNRELAERERLMCAVRAISTTQTHSFEEAWETVVKVAEALEKANPDLNSLDCLQEAVNSYRRRPFLSLCAQLGHDMAEVLDKTLRDAILGVILAKKPEKQPKILKSRTPTTDLLTSPLENQ